VVFETLGAVTWWVIAPSLFVLAVAIFLRALRWRALFEPHSRPPVGPTVRATLIGLMFNWVLPLRAGEAARVLALAKETRASRVEVLATAVAERLYDVVALLLLLFVATPFLPSVSWLGKAAVAALAFTTVLAAMIITLHVWGERPLRWAFGGLARLPRISVERTEFAATNLVRGLAALRRPEIATRGVVLTLVSWLAVALSNWLLLAGFDFGLGFDAALLVAIATNLSLVIPASPGAIGTFEAAVIVALSAYGVDESRALSYAILLHLLNSLPTVLAGLVALHRSTAASRSVPDASAGRSNTTND
jgi:glycosyltransferase 2 family protein